MVIWSEVDIDIVLQVMVAWVKLSHRACEWDKLETREPSIKMRRCVRTKVLVS